MSEVWIMVEHPDLENSTSTVTLNSFLNLYEKKGWVAVPTPSSAPETTRETFNRVFGSIDPADAPKVGPRKKKVKKTESGDE